eukprot:8604798-Heterocapsa_arctica.AAC.1
MAYETHHGRVRLPTNKLSFSMSSGPSHFPWPSFHLAVHYAVPGLGCRSSASHRGYPRSSRRS